MVVAGKVVVVAGCVVEVAACGVVVAGTVVVVGASVAVVVGAAVVVPVTGAGVVVVGSAAVVVVPEIENRNLSIRRTQTGTRGGRPRKLLCTIECYCPLVTERQARPILIHTLVIL